MTASQPRVCAGASALRTPRHFNANSSRLSGSGRRSLLHRKSRCRKLFDRWVRHRRLDAAARLQFFIMKCTIACSCLLSDSSDSCCVFLDRCAAVIDQVVACSSLAMDSVRVSSSSSWSQEAWVCLTQAFVHMHDHSAMLQDLVSLCKLFGFSCNFADCLANIGTSFVATDGCDGFCSTPRADRASCTVVTGAHGALFSSLSLTNRGRAFQYPMAALDRPGVGVETSPRAQEHPGGTRGTRCRSSGNVAPRVPLARRVGWGRAGCPQMLSVRVVRAVHTPASGLLTSSRPLLSTTALF